MKIRILITLLSLYVSSAFAIDMGVIEVSKNFSATLIFPDNVNQVIFGNNPAVSSATLPSGEQVPIFKYYEMYSMSNNVILRAKDEAAIEISITVILNCGSIYSGIIKYGEKKEKLEYDFREKKELGATTKISYENDTPQVEEKGKDQLIRTKLIEVINNGDKYYSLGQINSEVSFMVAYMRNDDQYTYFKINIINNSASEYIIDGIIFKHVEKKKGKLDKKEIENENIIMPVCKILPENMAISAYTTEKAGYVIPLFATGIKGKLVIQFVEKNGSRNAIIEMPAADLAKIDVFKK